jgi:hypothetical protein
VINNEQIIPKITRIEKKTACSILEHLNETSLECAKQQKEDGQARAFVVDEAVFLCFFSNQDIGQALWGLLHRERALWFDAVGDPKVF